MGRTIRTVSYTHLDVYKRQLLKGVPVYAGDIAGEMCTPTGAALIKYFATEFGNMPELTVERIGYGMGSSCLLYTSFAARKRV